ncbi:ribosome-inactivating family protein [Kitasatospora sp. NPDC004745]|uniref:ribosome-inactivating family protein n=1 Tax=Kitasatospora sp. NPDC004745 TaxID=3364019 RepID=UPI003694C15B
MHLHPITTVRRTGRQLAVLLLALAAACGTVNGLAAPQAHANTSDLWTDIDWHLEDFDVPRPHPSRPQDPPVGNQQTSNQSGAYARVVDRMRQLAGQGMAGVQGNEHYLDTTVAGRTNATNRVIRVLLWSNATGQQRADVALYFSVDNLYFMGFSSHGQHYRLNANYTRGLAESIRVHERAQTAPWVNPINSDGSYASLAATPTWRAAEPYTAANFLRHLDALSNATPANRNSNEVLRAMAFFIGATSEAARFGWIEHRIAAVIYADADPTPEPAPPGEDPRTIGRFGTDLENNWDTLSSLAHRTAQGYNGTMVPIAGFEYRDWRDLDRGGNGNRRIAPFLAIQGSGI